MKVNYESKEKMEEKGTSLFLTTSAEIHQIFGKLATGNINEKFRRKSSL